jgi:formylglycine-generating enzyme required for sulfatase activity
VPHSEDEEDKNDIEVRINRVLRGGSFLYPAGLVRSAYRIRDVPSSGPSSGGFRPARTFR